MLREEWRQVGVGRVVFQHPGHETIAECFGERGKALRLAKLVAPEPIGQHRQIVTFEARVTKFTAVQEFGRAIHPAMAQGQIEGGSAQGLGWALLEDVVMRDGAMANGQLTNYVIPTTLDTPPMDIVMLENPYAGGPFGAKGMGELPIDGPAPAVVNAIRHAGLDVRAIPATPEALSRAPKLAAPSGRTQQAPSRSEK